MQAAPSNPANPPAPEQPRNHVIEVKVQQVDDLFQPFDPAPMHLRSVAHEADAFITERAAEFPPTHPIRLTIRLPAGESRCCEAVQQAFRKHFSSAAEKRKVMLRQHFSFAWRTFFFAVVAAVVLVYLSQYIAGISELAVMNKIANGLSIAVWVVLWRPFEMLIHDWRPLDREYRLYRRLEGIQVESIAE
jgi:hypothetical protein